MPTPSTHTHTAAPAPAASGESLHVQLQLQLVLHRSGPRAAWTAELGAPGAGQPLSFASLPDLIGYIARLDHHPSLGGLR
jgi:hypothetical protein